MKIKTASKFGALGLVIIGSVVYTTAVQAVTSVNVDTTLSTVPVLDVAKTQDIDFGTWYLVHDGVGGDIVLTMDPDTGVVTPVAGGTSTATEVIPGEQGIVTVDIGDGVASDVIVQMTQGAIVPFVDGASAAATDVVLSAITYKSATENGTLVAATPVDITVLTAGAGAPEPVELGATITLTATPAPDDTFTASFPISFAY